MKKPYDKSEKNIKNEWAIIIHNDMNDSHSDIIEQKK